MNVYWVSLFFRLYKLDGSSSKCEEINVLAKNIMVAAAPKPLHCDVPPSDEGRRDASSGRAWARWFMGDDEVLQHSSGISPLLAIFPSRFCATLYI